MKRSTEKFKPDLIISSDWHLFEKNAKPPCRTDSIWEAQWSKVEQIIKLQKKYKVPIVLAGDLFEHWKTSPELLNKCSDILKYADILSIIGNHDMPRHNSELMELSGLQTLFKNNVIEYAKGQMNWGYPVDYDALECKNREIVVAHMMVWQGKRPWPGCTDPNTDKVFEMIPDVDLIITGHNHKTIVKRKGKRLLINPGSLTRHKADQMKHKPCVFLWNAKNNDYRIHYLNTHKDVISRQHIKIEKQKKKRKASFVAKLKQGWNVKLSFQQNVEIAIKEEKVPKKISKHIYDWLEQ